MSKWEGAASNQGVKPSCQDAGTASRKCSRCQSGRQACILPTGILKSRGIELARILAEATERSETVKAAQLAVSRALQAKRNTSKREAEEMASDAVAAEASAERQERMIQALERKVLALERKVLALECTAITTEANGEIANKVTDFLRLIDQRLVELSEVIQPSEF